MLFNDDNKRTLTTVDGLTYTGLYADDGSYNIVLDSAESGVIHSCGAYNVTTGGTGKGAYAPNGSFYQKWLEGDN